MDSIYLISLIVGGFFVLLSIFGGGETDHDSDADFDHDFDHDFDSDLDADHDFDGSFDTHGGPDFVDLLSLRALFLFSAFFGLTGMVLTWLGGSEPITAGLSTFTGMSIGLGGNYIIKKFAYEQVSSQVTTNDINGKTARVILPMEGQSKGRILLEARGQRMELTAIPFEGTENEHFAPDDEVVVVRMNGRIAEVVKPN